MSWFARSLVNSLVGDYEEEEEEEEEERSSGSQQHVQSLIGSPASGGDEPGSASRGVKEDLSELTKTLTRQFWGVASFLAPPPQSFEPPTSSSSQMSRRGLQPADLDPSVVGGSDDPTVAVESPRLAGIRSDFAEISGKVRSGISMLSHTKAVTEISKIASSFLPFGLEDAHDKDDIEEEEEPEGRLEEVDAVGVTEEVLMFARNISMHPETWLDFPLLRDNEDSDGTKFSPIYK